ncbi:DUF3465 domain-containing protein [Kingella negevensis]|uniref:DUF3465 domain-containing protein n=1 Tax=Kingella negevensis TaxID=1522312 RepID=UPI00254FCEB4|nr:DUF3465 domain-containing protein [Kingella negevensis]MDK4681047.1 DUF3465 domain-containing protein [Kingella negevensis]MDK4683249.1 DUF3465 domain-containing protein [Kingella negevensis]MDK4683921.1 DUF3465 domain-containing protein [Kingella negevensis]MDK4691619.1 DUF3465 domain-containing protein [Kingella negevensis]MDK4693230.1 DUF3465 domain-containing protein [Kingella negevensis]
MKKIIPLLLVIAAMGWQKLHPTTPTQPTATRTAQAQTQAQVANKKTPTSNDFEKVLQQAFENQQSNIQIQGVGTVSKTLPDDTKGTKHQRFIVKLSSGQTLLFAHNIDLAPKIRSLKKGDTLEFFGEYEWTEQGGVIHWTHHDPSKRHADGWLKHNGQLYQ